jgi:amino acid adenylation domain-containing protein
MFESGARCVLKVDPGSGAVTWRGQEGACNGNRPAAHLRFLPQISTQEPAYIFFTSGTTGVPKGVLGNHQGLSHFLKWQRDEFEIGPGDRSAQLIGLSFDAVLRDIFLPLTSGATLCLPDDEEAVSSEKILGWLDRQHISVLHTVPALAQMWLTSPPPDLHLKDLRIVFFAGEPLPDSLVKAWRELSSNRCEIVNLYGPTETTLTKCYYRVPVDCPAGRQPAGGPMPHTQVLILRDGHQLCGIGELGEVAIRTPFRTLGYIDGDELNRQRFLKNPFRDDDHDLVYITGDLARYREDGLIELAGRVDDQVKIRGIRVEPGEIETVLARHPGVKRCVVGAREDEPGNKRLIAYVVPAGEPPTAKSELREHLRRKLPDYMVPAAFVEVLELPLTANGKIDRAALPSPDYALAPEPYVGPRSVVEQILVQIWSEVLRLDQIGIYNTFFELGGHSLLATQVISRIHDTFHVDIPLRHLFEHPTVENLASIIEQSQMEQIGDDILSELLTRLSLLSDNEVESSLAGHGFS